MERTFIKQKNSKGWKKDLNKFKLENSIGWDIAIIKKINKFSAKIETQKNLEGIINYENISWTKKEFERVI